MSKPPIWKSTGIQSQKKLEIDKPVVSQDIPNSNEELIEERRQSGVKLWKKLKNVYKSINGFKSTEITVISKPVKSFFLTPLRNN